MLGVGRRGDAKSNTDVVEWQDRRADWPHADVMDRETSLAKSVNTKVVDTGQWSVAD